MCGAMQTSPSGCSAAASSCVAPWYEKPYMPMRPLHAECPRSHAIDLGAVAALISKRIEFAARTAPSAHILDRHVIAVPRKPHRMRIDNSGGNIAPVRLPHQQRRPRPFARRIVVIGNQHRAIAQPAFHAALQPHSVSAIDERHPQAPCLGSKLYIATRISAIRAAASLAQRSPFSAVAGEGSPITPLGAMSFVSQAKFAAEPSGLSNSG